MAFGMDQMARAQGAAAVVARCCARPGSDIGDQRSDHAAPGLPTFNQGARGHIGGSRRLRAAETLKRLRCARRLFDDVAKFKKTVTNPTQKT